MTEVKTVTLLMKRRSGQRRLQNLLAQGWVVADKQRTWWNYRLERTRFFLTRGTS